MRPLDKLLQEETGHSAQSVTQPKRQQVSKPSVNQVSRANWEPIVAELVQCILARLEAVTEVASDVSFKEATDHLGSLREIAVALNCPAYLVKVARMERTNRGYRPPPADWQRPVLALIHRRIADLQRLKERMESVPF